MGGSYDQAHPMVSMEAKQACKHVGGSETKVLTALEGRHTKEIPHNIGTGKTLLPSVLFSYMHSP